MEIVDFFEIILNFVKMNKIRDIGVLLNSQKQTEQQQSRLCLSTMIAVIMIFAKHGLAFRKEVLRE